MDRILLIESSKTQALQFTHSLEEAGYKVDCVHSAEDAFNKINLPLPDLIITDYRLPGMPGDELCRRIRADINAQAIPILMLASDKTDQVEQLALESGADDYVRKSEFDEVLLVRVQALFRKDRAWRASVSRCGHSKNSKILVVDDSDTYREYIAMSLQRAKYRIETAGTGTEALKQLTTQIFDGVVLDMILPDMNGVKMCQQFAKIRSDLDQSFVLLMLTGGEDPEEMNAVLIAGADDVVGKSRDFKIIGARLHALIRRNNMFKLTS